MRVLWWMWMICIPMIAVGQKKWDGGAGTVHWVDAANWHPDGVPSSTDSVELDNSLLLTGYTILLPTGNVSVECRKLLIRAGSEKQITVEIPIGSNAVPALSLTDAKEGLIIDAGGRFINASSADSSNPLQITGSMRIQYGGRYIHRTLRGNAYLTSKLSTGAGTETGIFEFDVPGNANTIVSLTGRTFGHLIFSAKQNGTKSYQASGSSNCIILGNLEIQSGARYNHLFTADLHLYGNLQLDGLLSLRPSTAATTGRSIHMMGNNSIWAGSGTIEINAHFREIEIEPKVYWQLQFPLKLPFDSNKLIIKGTADLRAGSSVSGNGSLLVENGGGLIVYAAEGLCRNCPSTPIQTKHQFYSSHGRYYFKGSMAQQTGIDFPDSVGVLSVENPSGIRLSRSVVIHDSLLLQMGILYTMGKHLEVPADQIKHHPKLSYVKGAIRVHLINRLLHIIPVGDSVQYKPVLIRSMHATPQLITISYNDKPDPHFGTSFWNIEGNEINKIIAGTIPQTVDTMQKNIPLETFVNEGNGWVLTAMQRVMVNGLTGIETLQPISAVSRIAIRQQLEQLLPIESVQLKGRVHQGYAQLELLIVGQDDPVIIQRSDDGVLFRDIDSLIPTRSGRYLWQDKRILTTMAFYRVEFYKNEKTAFSNVLRLGSTILGGARLYPNPAREKIFVFFKNSCSKTEYRIVNSSGDLVRKLSSNQNELDISTLAPGYYILQIAGCVPIITLPFTKN